MVLGSCKSKYEKLKRTSNDQAKKYTEAVKFYNKKGLYQSIGFGLMAWFRVTAAQAQAEDLYTTITLITNYKLKGLYHRPGITLKTFADTYPSSNSVPRNARFMVGLLLLS